MMTPRDPTTNASLALGLMDDDIARESWPHIQPINIGNLKRAVAIGSGDWMTELYRPLQPPTPGRLLCSLFHVATNYVYNRCKGYAEK
jgi:hypothetical protein